MTEPYLNLHIERKEFSGKCVLKDIHLDINKGEVVAIMGPSGGGKTTLARCLAGFESFEGKVLLDGIDISKLNPKDRSIGIVPQDGALFPHLNVEDNIAFGIKGQKNKAKLVQEYLSIVKMEDPEISAKKRVDQLSGGQQQRVAVARALAANPKVIILDESFSALDQWLRISVRREILKSLKTFDATVIVITHDVSEAFELSDRVAVLENGSLVQFDSSENLYEKPSTLSIAQLVGVANVLKYDEAKYGSKFVNLSSGRERQDLVLMTRPEDIHVATSDVESTKPLTATLKDVKSSGPSRHFYLNLSDDEVEIISSDPSFLKIATGEDVDISISSKAIIY